MKNREYKVHIPKAKVTWNYKKKEYSSRQKSNSQLMEAAYTEENSIYAFESCNNLKVI